MDSDVAVLFSCSLGEVLRGDRIVNTLYDVSSVFLWKSEVIFTP